MMNDVPKGKRENKWIQLSHWSGASRKNEWIFNNSMFCFRSFSSSDFQLTVNRRHFLTMIVAGHPMRIQVDLGRFERRCFTRTQDLTKSRTKDLYFPKENLNVCFRVSSFCLINIFSLTCVVILDLTIELVDFRAKSKDFFKRWQRKNSQKKKKSFFFRKLECCRSSED